MRSGARKAHEIAGDVRLRDKSHVVLRDSERSLIDPQGSQAQLDPQAMTARKHARLGLLIGGLAAIAVIAVVIFVATRPQAKQAPESPAIALKTLPDAVAPAAVTPDAAPIVVEIDAAGAPMPEIIPRPTPHTQPSVVRPPRPTPPVTAPSIDATPGQLSVSSDPYATIYVDGRKLGDTPLFRERLTAECAVSAGE